MDAVREENRRLVRELDELKRQRDADRRKREKEDSEHCSLVKNIVSQFDTVKTAQNADVIEEILKEIEYERKKYTKEVAALEWDNRKLRDRVCQLEEGGARGLNNDREFRRLQIEVDVLRDEKARLQRTVDQIEREKEDLRHRQPRDLQDELRRTQKELERLRSEKDTVYDDLKRERDSSQRRSQQLQEDLDRKKKEIEVLHCDKTQLEQKIEEERRHQHKPTDQSILEERLRQAHKEILDYHIEIGQLKDNLKASMQSQDMEEKAALKKNLQLEKDRVCDGLKKITEVSQENARLQRELQSCRSGGSHDAIIANLRTRIEELEKEKMSQPNSSQYLQEIEQLKRDNERCNKLCRKYQQEKDEMARNLETFKRERVNTSPLSPTQAIYKQSLEVLQLDYQKLRETYDKVSEDCAACHNERDELKTKNSQLVKDRRIDHQTYQKERDKSNEQISNLTLDNNRLKDQVAKLKSQQEASSKKEFLSPKKGKGVSFSEKVEESDSPLTGLSRPAARRPRSQSESQSPSSKPASVTSMDLQNFRFEMAELKASMNELKAGNNSMRLRLGDPIDEQSLEDVST